jgi:hypothetical protein
MKIVLATTSLGTSEGIVNLVDLNTLFNKGTWGTTFTSAIYG